MICTYDVVPLIRLLIYIDIHCMSVTLYRVGRPFGRATSGPSERSTRNPSEESWWPPPAALKGSHRGICLSEAGIINANGMAQLCPQGISCLRTNIYI